MGLIYVVGLLGFAWLIFKLVTGRESAKSDRTNRSTEDDRLADVLLEGYQSTNELMYGQEGEDPAVMRMVDWYVRLKEKFKHDDVALAQIVEDWKDYAFYLSSRARNIYLDSSSHVLPDEEQVDTDFIKDVREAEIHIEEIENRYADLLGSDYRQMLETERKTQKEVATKSFEKFMKS